MNADDLMEACGGVWNIVLVSSAGTCASHAPRSSRVFLFLFGSHAIVPTVTSGRMRASHRHTIGTLPSSATGGAGVTGVGKGERANVIGRMGSGNGCRPAVRREA